MAAIASNVNFIFSNLSLDCQSVRQSVSFLFAVFALRATLHISYHGFASGIQVSIQTCVHEPHLFGRADVAASSPASQPSHTRRRGLAACVLR